MTNLKTSMSHAIYFNNLNFKAATMLFVLFLSHHRLTETVTCDSGVCGSSLEKGINFKTMD